MGWGSGGDGTLPKLDICHHIQHMPPCSKISADIYNYLISCKPNKTPKKENKAAHDLLSKADDTTSQDQLGTAQSCN
jgi:hypothetical protein